MTPEDVIREYFSYLSKIENRQFKAPKFPSTRILEQAAEFLTWCTSKDIREPMLFLQFRLDSGRARRFRVPFRLLKSENMSDVWHKWAGAKYRVRNWEASKAAEMRTSEVERIKTLRDLQPAQESYQHFNVSSGLVEVCMKTQAISGGFHPKSRVCATCPLAIRCADKLNLDNGFDVIALRRNQLFCLPKHIAAAAIA